MKTYAMYTNAGDAAVYGIVVAADANGLSWGQVYDSLRRLSTQPGFEEATDTAVREAVYIDLFGE